MLRTEASTGARQAQARPAGSIAVRGVAAMDSSMAPGHDALVGELSGEVVAVITIRDGLVVANPFRETAAVVDLLRRRRATFLTQRRVR
jgi:hypothetical protein